MKGYFSKIARQSGLRIMGQGAAAQRPVNQRASSPEPLATIEHEETVMVPPALDKRGDSQKASATRKALPQEAAPKTKQAKQAKKDAKPTAKPPTMRSASELVREEESHDLSVEKISLSGETKSIDIAPVTSGQESNLSSIEQPIDVSRPQTPLTDGKKHSTPIETGKKSERNYFSRTAEIISGSDAEPAEVQTILLHEIQEWVAAGEQGAESYMARESQPIEFDTIEAIETEDTARTDDPGPGVVRIGQKRRERPVVQDVQYQSTEIEEQGFDLSIGTISVVIEGDEKPVTPAPAPQAQTGQSSQETSYRSSRLRRSFL